MACGKDVLFGYDGTGNICVFIQVSVHVREGQVHALATSTKAYIQILTAVRFFPEQEFSRGEKCMCA